MCGLRSAYKDPGLGYRKISKRETIKSFKIHKCEEKKNETNETAEVVTY